jgi:ribosome-binding factor A
VKEMSTRAARVAKEMQRQLSVILRDDLKDPRIGFTTITTVMITDDLRSAKVYFTTLGGGVQENNALAALNQANGFIRRLIGQRIDLRLVPEITFKLDKGISSGFAVDEILRHLEKEKEETSEK